MTNTEMWLNETISHIKSVKSDIWMLHEIMSLPNCNDCKNKDCEYKPKWGEHIRYNCPLHLAEADRKTENSSEFPNNCETCGTPRHLCKYCIKEDRMWTPKDEPTTQTETLNSNLTFEKRTMRDCYNCKRYETEGECIECHYEPTDEPQSDWYWRCPKCDHIVPNEYDKCVWCLEPKPMKPKVVVPKRCKGCDSASKIIEAYSRGFEDGAEAVKAIKVKALHKDCIEPYVTIEDEPQTNKEIVLDPSFAELSDEQFVEAMKLIEPQTEMPRCSVNGTPFDECGFCEYFNCDTCKCEADVPQTERSK